MSIMVLRAGLDVYGRNSDVIGHTKFLRVSSWDYLS